MQTTTCLICKKEPASASDCCERCGGLLRWIRSYYADNPKAAAKIFPDATFKELFDFESLDYVDWALEVESIFGVVISDRDAHNMKTVGDFLRHLRLAGAQWRPAQNIEITKGRFGGTDFKVVNRPITQ